MPDSNPEIGAFVAAAGLKTNYLEQGAGPPVLLLHGSGPGVTAHANWRLTLPALAERFRVLAMDVAGFGYTERREGITYDLDFWVRHVVAFLDALTIAKTHIVGNSFGGALALALAARHPDRVERLVLMGSVGTEFALTPGLDAVWGYAPSIDNMRALIDLFAFDKSLITEDLVRSRYQASIRPGYQESYSALFPAPRQRHIARLATPENAIRAIPHRCLVVHGREDQVIPVTNSFTLHDWLAHSELHVFAHCGHWTQIEKKDRFNRLVADFLSER